MNRQFKAAILAPAQPPPRHGPDQPAPLPPRSPEGPALVLIEPGEPPAAAVCDAERVPQRLDQTIR